MIVCQGESGCDIRVGGVEVMGALTAVGADQAWTGVGEFVGVVVALYEADLVVSLSKGFSC